MDIRKENNDLVISFSFNPALVEIVKRFESRKYDRKTKEWSVPIDHVKSVLEILIPFGFTARADVRDEYDKAIKHRDKITRIQSGEFTAIEKEVLESTHLPLFNFQKIGTGFLCASNSAILGDEPGLGKTIQSLAVTLIKNANKSLIICPATLKLNWVEEIEKWIQNKKIVVIKGSRKQRLLEWEKEADYYIMNYELLLKDLDEITKKEWDFIIADEATRISNPRAKQSKLIKLIPAKYRIAMTGTPLNNAIQDIWNMLDFCIPNYLGSYWQFVEKYCEKDRFGGIYGYKNLSELKEKLFNNMIRRKKADVLSELPPKLYESIYVDLDPEERKIYNAIKEEISEELKEYEINKVLEDKFLSNALVKLVRLKQVTDSLELVSCHLFSSKSNALKELLTDVLINGSKAIIFTQFSKMADILVRELEMYNPLLISGKVENATRQKNVELFQNSEENRIIICTEAGGFGLNMHRANYVIHYDMPWSIAKIEQREGRAHRIGQKNNLTVFKLIAVNTVDEYVLKVLHKKQKLAEQILENKEKVKKVKISKKDIEKMLA